MRMRCPGARIIGTSVIEGYRLLFKGSRTGSYLTIEPQEGARKFLPAVGIRPFQKCLVESETLVALPAGLHIEPARNPKRAVLMHDVDENLPQPHLSGLNPFKGQLHLLFVVSAGRMFRSKVEALAPRQENMDLGGNSDERNR